MNGNRPITITLLANAGILIQYEGEKLLVDGLHVNEYDGFFSGLSQHVLEALIRGRDPLFKDIGHILYTHCHPDHFTLHVNEEYLKRHSLSTYIIPESQSKDFGFLRQLITEKVNHPWFLDIPLYEKKKVRINSDILITIFNSKHSGDQYSHVENYCYLLQFGSKKIFIIGDGEYNADYYWKMLNEEEIDLLLINPLFLTIGKGREVIKAIGPKKFIVYHIPFREEDKNRFRRMVHYNAEKHKEHLPPVEILMDELQEIIL